jgi:type I restriction enzyme S subunit
VRDWKFVALSEVADIERSGVEASAIRNGTLYVGLENIQSGGNFLNVRAVDQGELASNKFAFTGEHLLYGKLRPYLAKIARPTFAGVCSTDIVPIKPGPLLNRDYLSHFLRQPTMVEFANSRATGANLPRLSPRVLADFEVPLPPLPEQRRIAAILDQAETLRTQRRAALAQLDSLTQSLFLDMFGDPEVNEKRLPVCSLSSLCNRVTDGTHQSPRWETSGVPFLFISNIVKGQITFETHKYISSETYSELTKRCPIEVGDILYTTVGSYGNAAVVATNERFAFQRHIAHIKPDANKVDPLFLAAMIQSVGVRRQVDKVAKGVAQKTVNLADLKSLQVFAPPLPLQQTFATRVQAIEALKAQHRAALATQDALFASLQQRAFAGAL